MRSKKVRLLILVGILCGAYLTYQLNPFDTVSDRKAYISSKEENSQITEQSSRLNKKTTVQQDKQIVENDINDDKTAEVSESVKEELTDLEKVTNAFSNSKVSNTQDDIDDLTTETINDNLQTRHILNVTPQIQKSWNTCAPTTVSMMLSSRGVQVSQEILAKEMGTDDVFGTHNANAIQILNRHLFGYDYPQSNQAGYRLATITTADSNSEEMKLFKERLKKNIADGYPMYYTFDNSRIYSGSHGEHNVIGIGYQLAEDGDIAYLYYLDPSYTQQDSIYGGLKKVTPKELFYAMLTCDEPNYAW